MITIYVRAQVDPKSLSPDMVVETNRVVSIQKKVSDLRPGDEFLLDGAWYDVRLIVQTKP